MARAYGKFLTYASAIILTGYGLMKFTVPDEAEMRSRLDPALLKEAEKRRAQHKEHNQALMEQIRKTAESDKPVWVDFREKKN
ncbi:hypothetical protein BJ944DRAFT_269023 [Cunninghamella echinulata]|nr:hypothetical protein BJ944DRAFT_269023 [Cunninghamella echinulata]